MSLHLIPRFRGGYRGQPERRPEAHQEIQGRGQRGAGYPLVSHQTFVNLFHRFAQSGTKTFTFLPSGIGPCRLWMHP